MTAYFSSEMEVVRRKWNVFQVLKEKKASTVSNKNTLQE
jgi:hypothetical protein